MLLFVNGTKTSKTRAASSQQQRFFRHSKSEILVRSETLVMHQVIVQLLLQHARINFFRLVLKCGQGNKKKKLKILGSASHK